MEKLKMSLEAELNSLERRIVVVASLPDSDASVEALEERKEEIREALKRLEG